jgi:hypothetical protein
MSDDQGALFPDDGGDAAILLQLAELRDRITKLEQRAGERDLPGYAPVPAPAWHALAAEPADGEPGALSDRDEHRERLATWVDQVYRPDCGHFARALPECWFEHPLCLSVLDWLSELWNFLYLRPNRGAGTLVSQADWYLRLLPGAAALMAAECDGDEHQVARLMGGAVR